MLIKKSIILVLALIGTSLFAKGPVLDGEFTGVDPLDASRTISITFKFDNSDTKVVKCNFNFQCNYETEASKLKAVLDGDMFSPNGDHGWRVAYVNTENQKVFEILFSDPDGRTGIILKQLGLGLDVPLKKAAVTPQ